MEIAHLQSVFAQLEQNMANGPIVPDVTPQEIRSHLGLHYDFTKPMALDDVTADVERMMRRWHVQVTHPRYFGLFNPSVTLASVVAETLAAMYNPQLATWRTSPAANEMERHTLAWLTGKFGLPARSIRWGISRDSVGRNGSGFTSTLHGAARPSSPHGSAAIWPASTLPTRSRATRTSGSRSPWAPGCSSAGTLTLSAKPSAR